MKTFHTKFTETGQPSEPAFERSVLQNELGLPADPTTRQLPLLYSLVQKLQDVAQHERDSSIEPAEPPRPVCLILFQCNVSLLIVQNAVAALPAVASSAPMTVEHQLISDETGDIEPLSFINN